jgi:aryl-alcohol dehydrogenase-like predicted oxidoreductase
MMKRVLGHSGIEVSVLGLGGGALGVVSDTESDMLLSTALDLGITFFDTARSYGDSEERIGRWLSSDRGRRQRIVLSTKTGYGASGTTDWTYPCVERGVDEALVRMATDVIDVVFLHSCPRETLERGDVILALERARAAGKVRAIGYSGENDALAWAVDCGRFDVVQCSVNVFDQRSLDGAIARARGIGVVGKRALGNVPWGFAECPIGDYAETYWKRMRAMQIDPGAMGWPELALRFAAFAPGVATVLVGTRHAEHLRANALDVARGPLPDIDVARIRDAFRTHDEGWNGEI